MLIRPFILSTFIFLLHTPAFTQHKPVLKQQFSLDGVSEVVSSSRQATYLANSLSGYLLIDQASKLQIGSLKLNLERYDLPGWGKTCLWGDSSFIISTGSELLEADAISGRVDTLFNGVAFPELIINYIPWPGDENILLIAAKTYPMDSKKMVNFSKTDSKGNTVYDDSKNCRLILFDTRTKKIIKSVSVPHAITVFADNLFENNILAGTFQGDIIKIDAALSATLIFHAFDIPVHSLVQQQDILFAVPHKAPKYISDYGDGTIYIYNSITKEKKQIKLPNQKSIAEEETGITAVPTNHIFRIFSLPKDSSVLVNFGFRGLLKISVPQLDTAHYPVPFNEVSFYCFNKDSTQLLSATSGQIGFFGSSGKLAAYDLQRKKFQTSFKQPAGKEKYASLYKLFDKEGNYHFIGLKTESYNDTLVIYSSNKTSPTFLISHGGDFIINEKDTGLIIEDGGKAIYGSLQLDKLRQDKYVFNIDNYYDKKDTVHPEIYTVKLDTRNLPEKDIPYGITGIHDMRHKQKLITGYIPQKSENLYWVRVIDSTGKVKIAVSGLKRGNEPDFCKVSPSGNRVAFYHQKNNIDIVEVWDAGGNKKIFEKIFSAKTSLQFFGFDKTQDVLWFAQLTGDNPIEIFKVDLLSPVITASLFFAEHGFLSFQTDIANNLIASENYDQVYLHRLSDRKLLWQLNPSTSYFKVYNHPGGFAFATDKEYHVINNDLSYLYFTSFDGLKPVEILNDYLYKGDKAAINNLAFVLNRKGYVPADYDMYFNRPDSVLLKSGSTNNGFNQLMANTVEKRKRYYPAKNLEELLKNSPLFSVLNKNNIGDVISSPELKLTVKAQSVSGKPITALHVLDNGVPVFGNKGFAVVSPEPLVESMITIPLAKGRNSLQVYASDADGLISSAENISVVGDFPAPAPKTYFIGIGVSNYLDNSMNLHYADKDILDLATEFSKKFPGSSIDTFINTRATAENILAIKNKLKQTGIEDRVVISLSGHGLVDTGSNFYFATHDIDFNDPAKKGLKYNDIENLLEDIPARKKLLLIDACHSGEIDREAKIDSLTQSDSPGLKEYAPKGFIVKTTAKSVGLQNSFELMKELFADVSKNNGTVVISAAGGLEYALEDAKYSNGVFTYAIKKGLLEKAADKNADGDISVNELKEYVSKTVEELTKGKQKPTTRKEVLEFDWNLW